MAFEDKRLRCADCGAEFVWTAGEQQFYADKQLSNEPRRCRNCKSKRAAQRAAAPKSPREPVETVARCSACGRDTTVPFRPVDGRPVYCRDCFQQRRQRGAPRR